jgi:hypothetical protein
VTARRRSPRSDPPRSGHARANELSHRLTHALATIQNMERSWFWKARGIWARISGR